MVKKFLRNRRVVQSAMYIQNFIEQCDEDEYTITESKTSEDKLRELTLTNIPIPTDGDHCYWVIDLEKEDTAFIAPEKYKKAEKAIILYNHGRLYIILIEMKQQLKPHSGFNEIIEKLQDSISRILMLLPTFVFYDPMYCDLSVRFYALIAYNHELLTKFIQEELEKEEEDRHQDLSQNPLFDVFRTNKIKKLKLDTRLGTREPVWVTFCQNDDPDSSEMYLNVKEVITDLSSDEFEGRFVCPHAVDVDDECS